MIGVDTLMRKLVKCVCIEDWQSNVFIGSLSWCHDAFQSGVQRFLWISVDWHDLAPEDVGSSPSLAAQAWSPTLGSASTEESSTSLLPGVSAV